MTPVGKALNSINSKAAGIVPSANKRFPVPSVMGIILNRNSSTKSLYRSVCISIPLPCTRNIGPSSFFKALILATTSSLNGNDSFHVRSTTLSDTTYFLALLNESPITPECLGQYPANILYVFEPSNKSNGTLNSSLIILAKDSSAYGTVQPP